MLTPIEAKEKAQRKADEYKIDKQVVMYVDLPETDYKCVQCIYYKELRCALYGPTIPIKEWGGCNAWVHGERGKYDMPWLGLLTKEQTGYMENKNGFSCKRCEEFLPGQNACKKINRFSVGDDPGIIGANACCNRWEKDGERGDKTNEQLMQLLKRPA